MSQLLRKDWLLNNRAAFSLNVAVTQNHPFDQLWLIRLRRCKQGKTFIFETKGLKWTTSWFNQKGEKRFIWVEENLICLEPKKTFSLQKESFFVGIDKFDKKAFFITFGFQKTLTMFLLGTKVIFGSLWWTMRQFFDQFFNGPSNRKKLGKWVSVEVNACGCESTMGVINQDQN